jgi:hypothetical protein
VADHAQRTTTTTTPLHQRRRHDNLAAARARRQRRTIAGDLGGGQKAIVAYCRNDSRLSRARRHRNARTDTNTHTGTPWSCTRASWRRTSWSGESNRCTQPRDEAPPQKTGTPPPTRRPSSTTLAHPLNITPPETTASTAPCASSSRLRATAGSTCPPTWPPAYSTARRTYLLSSRPSPSASPPQTPPPALRSPCLPPCPDTRSPPPALQARPVTLSGGPAARRLGQAS